MPTLHIMHHGSLRCTPWDGSQEQRHHHYFLLPLLILERDRGEPVSFRVPTACLCLCLWRVSTELIISLLPLATSCSYLGVFQMGERHQPYQDYYWLLHLPDQMLFPILGPSQSPDFAVSSFVMFFLFHEYYHHLLPGSMRQTPNKSSFL